MTDSMTCSDLKDIQTYPYRHHFIKRILDFDRCHTFIESRVYVKNDVYRHVTSCILRGSIKAACRINIFGSHERRIDQTLALDLLRKLSKWAIHTHIYTHMRTY